MVYSIENIIKILEEEIIENNIKYKEDDENDVYFYKLDEDNMLKCRSIEKLDGFIIYDILLNGEKLNTTRAESYKIFKILENKYKKNENFITKFKYFINE